MLIEDLIKELEDFKEKRGNIPVKCTWEGVTPDISGMYLSKDDDDNIILLIDSDDCFYRERYEYTEITKTGD